MEEILVMQFVLNYKNGVRKSEFELNAYVEYEIANKQIYQHIELLADTSKELDIKYLYITH